MIGKAIILLLALILVGALAQDAQTIVPFSNTITNPCNGEVVSINGRLHIVLQSKDKVNVFHINTINVSGEGSFGNTYRFNQVLHSTSTEDPSEVTTSILTFRAISQGKAPNFLITSTFHITVNAQGEITAAHIKSEPRCTSTSAM